jgi:glycine dehydrogenase subunit 2
VAQEREQLIFEKSQSGRQAIVLPKLDVPASKNPIPKQFLRSTPPALPEVGELEAVRHFTNLSYLNHCIDKGFYPLGSCTMK